MKWRDGIENWPWRLVKSTQVYSTIEISFFFLLIHSIKYRRNLWHFIFHLPDKDILPLKSRTKSYWCSMIILQLALFSRSIIFLPKCSKKFMLLKWTINYLRILSWLDYALFPSFCQGVSGVMRKRLLSQNAEYQWNFTAVISTLFPFSFINIAKERMVQNSRNPLLYTANFSSWFLMPTQRTAWFGNMMVVIITKTTRDILSTSIKR